MISRRTFLGALGAVGVNARRRPRARSQPSVAPSALQIIREPDGSYLRLRVVNRSDAPVAMRDLVVFEETLTLPPESALYGEGFQMLSQTGGTIAQPADLSQYADAKHYRIPTLDSARAYYGLLTLTPPHAETRVFAFTSCARFSGYFVIRGEQGRGEGRFTVQAVMDGEGLTLQPQESCALEELFVASGSDRDGLLADVASRLARHHAPPLRTASRPPTGWCSWYCFGPNVTAQQVLDNLDVIARSLPSLKYIQIDDGYQRAMGDWLDTGAAFGGSVRTVLAEIARRGFVPAIWVAPFIAEEQSRLFQEQPDWFVADANGKPLRADRVTFGGWRRGPWYAIDGTHPDAQSHLTRVFRTMREEWGCAYFKLDANFWGAMHGGRFHDVRATRVEAYRRGMTAIRRGAGDDSFLLGCNHPIWPSIGTIHGSRSSNDIKRSWERVMTTARQNLSRNWQNGRLWWNDPDAVVLEGELSDAECQFHATAIYASGGMVLSGDDLTKISPARTMMLRRLLPPSGIAATFADLSLRVGRTKLPDAEVVSLFNWRDTPDSIAFAVGPAGSTRVVTDVWTGERLGPHAGTMTVTLPPRSARLLEVRA